MKVRRREFDQFRQEVKALVERVGRMEERLNNIETRIWVAAGVVVAAMAVLLKFFE